MLIKLIRNQPQGKALFGQLYVDGEYFCDTLENTDYAIPAGFYRLRVTFSPRWQVLLPILDGVWGYRKGVASSNNGVAWSNNGVVSSNSGVASSNSGVASSNSGVASSNSGQSYSTSTQHYSTTTQHHTTSTQPYSTSTQVSSADRLWRVCFKKWFVGMVASWLKDEVVNHQVLVLIGRQGIYKTTWLEHLIPTELRAYCCKLANTTQINKDDRLRLAEFGLINLDELDSMSSRELNTMKSIITATDVNERAAYGYNKERKIRLASFCASSNRREFLTDITGNRRWLPFEVENIQNPYETILPYERMYAQARYLIQYGFNYWFDLDDIATLEEHNETFRAQESEEQLLPILFDVPAEGRGEFMTTAQISERLITYGNIKKPMPLNRLGVLLGTAGYQKKSIGKQRIRGWLVYQRSTDEINANKNLYAK